MTAAEIRKVQEELRDSRTLPTSKEGDEATAAVHLTVWVAAFLPEIAAQLAELNENLRALRPQFAEPEDCRNHACSYFKHYLAYGPADLTHEGFHAAEEKCREWQQRANDWLKEHEKDNEPLPDELDRMCQTWEARVRA